MIHGYYAQLSILECQQCMEIKGEFRFLTALTFKVYAGDNYQLFKIEVIFLSLSETYGGGGLCNNSSSFSDRGQSCIDFSHESRLMVISSVVQNIPHRDLEIISSLGLVNNMSSVYPPNDPPPKRGTQLLDKA